MDKTYIELLAPAKDLEVGLAAIDHGADAVYIGGPAFGAREKAGNSIEVILCRPLPPALNPSQHQGLFQ